MTQRLQDVRVLVRKPEPDTCTICGNVQGLRQGECAIGSYHEFPKPERSEVERSRA